MRDLIERVAEKAGWPVTFDVDDLSSPYVAVGNDWIYVEKSELKGVDYGQPATIEFTSVDSDWRVNGVFPLVTCCVIDPGWKLEL